NSIKEIAEKTVLPTWFSIDPESQMTDKDEEQPDTVEIGDYDWSTTLGNQGYIPKKITNSLNKEQVPKLIEATAKNRHELWKDYWQKHKQILSASNAGTSSSPSPTGEPPPQQGATTTAVSTATQQPQLEEEEDLDNNNNSR